MSLKALIYRILGISTDQLNMKFENKSYTDSEGWYVMKPKGWRVGMKMSPDYDVLRVDMKSLREHVCGGKDENQN